MEHPHAIPPFTDDSRPLKDCQVPGDVGLVNVDQFVQLAHTPVTIRQRADDQHARRVRQRLQYFRPYFCLFVIHG